MHRIITPSMRSVLRTIFLTTTAFILLFLASCTKDEEPVLPDQDNDGVVDEEDNCPLVANPNQEDSDGDGTGDVCENDADGDGVIDDEDNCPEVANPDQEDKDGDGIGDVCEEDSDGDGVPDDDDNCPDEANPDQQDTDEDGIGDVCDEVPTTVAQDKANVQGALDSTIGCINTFESGMAIQTVLADFIGLSDGDTLNLAWAEELLDSLSSVVPESMDEARFDMATFAGTYTYNHGEKTWSRTADQTSRVIFNFPSSPTETTNNATLTIENYSDTEVTIGDSPVHLPTSVTISLVVDSQEVITVDLKDIEYATNSGFQIPVAIDVSIYMNPFSLDLIVDKISSTEFAVDLTFSDGSGGCSTGVHAEVKLDSDDYENLTEQSLLKLTFAIHANRMSIESTGGVAELLQLTDPTIAQINEFLDLGVNIDDIRIADIVVNEDEFGETVVLLQYKDDSSEDSATYYEDFLNDLEMLFNGYFGTSNP